MCDDLYSIQKEVKAEMPCRTGSRGDVRPGKPFLFSVAPDSLDMVGAQERETEGAQDWMLEDTPCLLGPMLKSITGERG